MTFKDKTDKRRYANIHIRILVLGSRSAWTTAYHLIRIQNYQRHPSDRASAAVTVPTTNYGQHKSTASDRPSYNGWATERA